MSVEKKNRMDGIEELRTEWEKKARQRKKEKERTIIHYGVKFRGNRPVKGKAEEVPQSLRLWLKNEIGRDVQACTVEVCLEGQGTGGVFGGLNEEMVEEEIVIANFGVAEIVLRGTNEEEENRVTVQPGEFWRANFVSIRESNIRYQIMERSVLQSIACFRWLTDTGERLTKDEKRNGNTTRDETACN